MFSTIKAVILGFIASAAAFIHEKVTQAEQLPIVEDALSHFQAAIEHLQAVAIVHDDEADYQAQIAAEANAAAAASATEADRARAIAANIAAITTVPAVTEAAAPAVTEAAPAAEAATAEASPAASEGETGAGA